MESYQQKFEVNDYVFANKIKGDPTTAWPAKILKVMQNKYYCVYFYGTGEIAINIKSGDLFLYIIFKDIIVNETNLKDFQFKEAMYQMEAASYGVDFSPIELPSEIIQQIQATSSHQQSQSEPIYFTSIAADNINNNDDNIKEIKTKKIENQKFQNLMFAITPTNKLVGIQLDHNRRKRFNDVNDEKLCDLKRRKLAIHQMNRLDTKDMPHKHIQLEKNLEELDIQIRQSLRLVNGDPEKCIQLMEKYKSLQVSQIMLKRNQQCVETLRHLCRYIGNTDSWNMTEEALNSFYRRTTNIRERAEEIYNEFSKLIELHRI